MNEMFAALPLLAHCKLQCCCGSYARHVAQPQPTGFPEACLRCTRLTNLQLIGSRQTLALDFGGLPHDISSLQQLKLLRLEYCVTRQLTPGIAALGQLAGLTVQYRDSYAPGATSFPLPRLPADLLPNAPVLAALTSLDIGGVALPAVIPRMAGLQQLTLRDTEYNTSEEEWSHAQLSSLGSPAQLTSLRLIWGSMEELHSVSGLAACTGLKSLSLIMCEGVTWPALEAALLHMPHLSMLDISHSMEDLGEPAAVARLLRRHTKAKLRDLHFALDRLSDMADADFILKVQRLMPSAAWHFASATDDDRGRVSACAVLSAAVSKYLHQIDIL